MAWDPIARIEVSRVPAPDPGRSAWPTLFGPDREMLSRFRLVVTQNNNAFTYAPDYDGDPAHLKGLEDTVYAVAYRASLAPRPRVLIVGVGAGHRRAHCAAAQARLAGLVPWACGLSGMASVVGPILAVAVSRRRHLGGLPCRVAGVPNGGLHCARGRGGAPAEPPGR